jgi:phosphotriesterase-related protein
LTVNKEIVGKVQTVLGLVLPETLGIILPHEHLMIDFRVVFKEPKYASDRYKATLPVSLNNLEWIRHNRLSCLDNLLIGNEEEAITEAMLFKNEGGGTIVDVSNRSFARDPRALLRISRSTGLNIIMGAGYFVSGSSNEISQLSEKSIEEEFVKEVFEGVDDSGIRIGVIGELGCSWPLKKEEKKILSAAGRAQKITGIPISIHPGQHTDAPFKILDILIAAGGDPSHIIMSHLERTLLSFKYMEKFAKTGCHMEFDAFGKEGYFSSATKTDLSLDIPNDHYRINMIIKLIQAGYGDQLLISQDICTKDMLIRYGGYGYAHILKRAVPIMRLKGMKENDIMRILKNNPQRVFTIF